MELNAVSTIPNHVQDICVIIETTKTALELP